MKKMVCFYHANCVDGAAAAAILKRKYSHISCHPMNHGNTITVPVKGKTVFVVDFSFEVEIFKKLKSEADQVYWYDHHKTALPTQEALGWGTLDLNESGASLTWKMEYPGEEMPRIIQYVKDKDLWEWKLVNSREMSTALREMDEIHNPNSQTWRLLLDQLSDSEFQKLIDRGAQALKGQKTRILHGIKSSFEVDFHGYRALAVNWGLESSEMGEYIYKDLGYEVAILFNYTSENWNFSLRSNRIDVSAIATEYGGGGHPGAAGFRTHHIDWLLRLQKPKK